MPLFCLSALNAATVGVTTTTDQDDGSLAGAISLREAIRYSNSGDTISIPIGTYLLTRTGATEDAGSTGDLDIGSMVAAKNLTINGQNKTTTIIDGNGTDRVFHVINGTVAFANLTIRNGASPTVGGAIRVTDGDVLITNCNLTDCTSNAAGNGGGAVSMGISTTTPTLRVNSCNFSNNQAKTTTGFGGAAFIFSGDATFTNCDFSNNTAVRGGAIYNNAGAALFLDDCTFDTNSADHGGGIFSSSSVTMTGGGFDGNVANIVGGGLYSAPNSDADLTNVTLNNNRSLQDGGAIAVDDAIVFADSCAITTNRADFSAAFHITGGDLELTNSLVDANISVASGAAAYNYQGILTIDGCMISNHQALAAAVYNDNATLTIYSTQFVSNKSTSSSAGVINVGASSRADIYDSRFSANDGAQDESAIENSDSATTTCATCLFDANIGSAITHYNGRMELVSCTLSGNQAGSDGGAVWIRDGLFDMRSSTLSANHCVRDGGGLFIDSVAAPTVSLTSTLIGGNFRGLSTPNDAQGMVEAASSFNLVGVGVKLTGLDAANANIVGTDAAPVDAKLGPLADNGGPTPTHSLLFDSPAIDKGLSTGLQFDQRGFIRIIDNPGVANATGGDASDIGAVESQTAFVVLNSNDSGAGSLREALTAAAGANNPNAPNTIVFNIDNLQSIDLQSALPSVTSQLILDGTTQPGFAALPIVELNGANAGNLTNGLMLSGHTGSVVRGLVIRGFKGNGIDIEGGGSHSIALNLIGVNLGASTADGNGLAGIRVFDSSNNEIRPDSGYGNVISGNLLQGILIGGAGATGNVVQGNYIGTDISGNSTTLGNKQQGVLITQGASNNFIGSDGDGLGDSAEGNLILNSSLQGVFIDSGTGNRVSVNAIGNNGGLGIDLGLSGATLNDANDADSGANGLQNFPVLTNYAGSTVTGVLNSKTNTQYRIEFYGNPAYDVSGYGEGKILIGTTDVTTNAQGTAPISATVTLAGSVISAVAIGPEGSSEFSPRNLAPRIVAPPSLTTNEDQPLTLAISIDDPDSNGANETFTFVSAHGNLQIDTSVPGGVSAGEVTGNNSHSVALASTIAKVRTTFAAANSLRYVPDSNYNGSDTITITGSDSAPAELGGGATGNVDINITIDAVGDAPIVASVSTNEDTISGPITIDASGDPSVQFIKITSITGGSLFQNDGVTAISNNTFITVAQGNAGVKFMPALNSDVDGTFQVQGSTTNSNAGLTNDVGTATVVVNAVPDAPSLTLQAVSGNEGSPIALNISAALADNDGSEILSAVLSNIPIDATFNNGVANAGSGTVFIAGSALPGLTMTLADNLSGDSPLPVSVSAVATESSNSNFAITSKTFNFTVINVKPVLSNVTSTPIDEGDTAHLEGDISDAGVNDNFTVTVDWGDGSTPIPANFVAGTTHFDLTHHYLDNNPAAATFTVSITLRDKDNGTVTQTAQITVNNLAPEASPAVGFAIKESATTTVQLAEFTDAGTDTHTATIDWGDGSPIENGIVVEPTANPGTVSASHAYSDNRPLPYQITVVITDDDGDSDTVILDATVSNAAPTAIFQKSDDANTATLGAVKFTLPVDSAPDAAAGFHYAYDFNNDGVFDSGDGTYIGSSTASDVAVPVAFIRTNPNQTIRGRIIDKDNGFTDYLLRKPEITSNLFVFGSLNANFSYTITADGEPASTFDVTELPGTVTFAESGLTFNGANRISGKVVAVGELFLRISASSLAGTDEEILHLSLRDPQNLNDPVIISAATATPNLSLPGVTVSFSVAATDADGNALTYTWNFGDGATAEGANATHKYTAFGVFTAKATVFDGRYSVSQDVTVTVLDPAISSLQADSLAFSFDLKKNLKHSMTLKGKAPAGTSTSAANLAVTLTILGTPYQRTFTTSSKGSATNGTAALKMKYTSKTQLFSLSVTDKSPTLFSQLTALGFTNTTTPKTGVEVIVPIILTIKGEHHPALVTEIYKATMGKAGKAAKKKVK